MRKKLKFIFLLFLLFITSSCDYIITETPTPSPTNGKLTVCYIDVGQADSILIYDSENSILIDAGNNDDGDDVVDFIKSKGITKLDYAFGTHPHEDHIGGLDVVLSEIKTDNAVLPDCAADTNTYNDLMDVINEKKIPITTPKPNDVYTLGDIKIDIFAPIKEYKNTNDNSIVAKLTYGSKRFLFTGDAEIDAEKDIVNSGVGLSCDVLKAGHHGSNTSSSYSFLRECNPQYVVISCGKDNSYGHPHENTLSRFRDLGATVYRTDILGTIEVTTDGDTLDFNKQGNESDKPHNETGGLGDIEKDETTQDLG